MKDLIALCPVKCDYWLLFQLKSPGVWREYITIQNGIGLGWHLVVLSSVGKQVHGFGWKLRREVRRVLAEITELEARLKRTWGDTSWVRYSVCDSVKWPKLAYICSQVVSAQNSSCDSPSSNPGWAEPYSPVSVNAVLLPMCGEGLRIGGRPNWTMSSDIWLLLLQMKSPRVWRDYVTIQNWVKSEMASCCSIVRCETSSWLVRAEAWEEKSIG